MRVHRAADRLALWLLAVLAILAIGPSLIPGKAFVAVHTSTRRPFDTGLTSEILKSTQSRGNFETGDQLFQVLPERRAFNDAIARGQWPIWWPENGGGISLLGAPGAELLEPRALILSFIFGPVGALGVQAALAIFTLAALSYWWFRLRDYSSWAAATGAIVFALGGALTSNLYYICKVDSMIVLPGALVAIELWYKNRRGLCVAVAALSAADSMLASFPQNTALCVYCIFIWIGFRIYENRAAGARPNLKFILFLILSIGAGFAVGAVHLLPVAEWAREAQRGASLGGQGFRAGPANWLSMFAPLAIGDPTIDWSDTYKNPVIWILESLQSPGGRGYSFTETTIYAGLGAIPLIAAGLFRGKRAIAPSVLLLFCLGVSAGTPLALLPGVSVSAPSRALAGAGFFFAWLAADGYDAIVRERRARAAFFAGILLLFAVSSHSIYLQSDAGPSPESIADAAFERWSSAEKAASRPAPAAKELQKLELRWNDGVKPELLYLGIASLVAAAAASLAAGAANGRRLLTLVTAADLLLLTIRILPAQDRNSFLPETPAVREVRRAAGAGRVARIATGERAIEGDWEMFQASIPAWFGIADVSCYVIFPNANQINVAGAFAPTSVLYQTYLGAFPRSVTKTALPELFGISVWLCRERLDDPSLEAVIDRAGSPEFHVPGFHAYKRKNALGRAWIAPVGRVVRGDAEMKRQILDGKFDPAKTALLESEQFTKEQELLGSEFAGGGTVEIDDISPREVRARVRGTRGGFLVEAAPDCPGWSATLDGFPVELYHANRYGRAVWVPEGDHEVIFTYMSRAFVYGGIVSLLALLAIPFLAIRAARTES